MAGKTQTAKFWKTSLKHDALVETSPDPAEAVGNAWSAANPNPAFSISPFTGRVTSNIQPEDFAITFDEGAIERINQAVGVVRHEEQQANLIREAEFADQVERAYYDNGGQIPMSWFLAQDPDDLRLIGETGLATYLERAGAWTNTHREYQEGRDAEIERRVTASLRSRTAASIASGMPMYGLLAQHMLTDEQTQEMTEEELRAYHTEQVDNEYFGLEVAPSADLEELGLLGKGLGLLGKGIEGVAFGLGLASQGIAEGFDQITPGDYNFYDANREKWEEDNQALADDMRAQLALPDQELMDRAAHLPLESLWHEMGQNQDAQYQEYLAMAGGDQIMAFGFFAADVTESPEAQDQIRQVVDEMNAEMQDRIQQVEDQDYRASQVVLDTLAIYGQQVPMRLATAFSLLLTDGDVRNSVINNRWSELWEEVEANEFSPARVLGIDGTATGLVLDLGAGIAFDPTTWIFGPRGTTARVRTVAQAAEQAASPVVQRTIRDLVTRLRSPSHGPMSSQVLGSWLDDVGFLDEFMYEVGVIDQALPGHGWMYAERGIHSQLVRTESIAGLMDDVQRGATAGRNVDDLVGSIRNSGFNEPIEIALSRTGRTLHVTDGLKRLQAAQQMGLDTVPVTMRIVDDVPGGFPVGTSIDEIIGAGERLPKGLRTDDLVPNVADAKFARPDRLLPDSMVWGKDVDFEKLSDIARRAIEAGARPPSAAKLAIAAGFAPRLHAAMQKLGKPGRWLERYATPQNTITRFELTGPGAMRRLNETTIRLWGDDTAKANEWLGRLWDHRRTRQADVVRHADQLTEVQKLRDRMTRLEDAIGGSPMGALPEAVAGSLDESSAIARSHKRLVDEYRTVSRDYTRRLAMADDFATKMPDNSNLVRMVEEMWEDYNRTHIASKPFWKEFVGEDGLVPWDVLRRGRRGADDAAEGARQFFPEELQKMAEENGVGNIEQMMDRVSFTQNNAMAVRTPISPLDLTIAAQWGGAKYIRASQTLMGNAARETSWAFMRFWLMDKVFRPATAVTVSVDEITRIIHTYGSEAAMRWMQDRALFMAARGRALVQKRRIDPRFGTEGMSPKAAERIRRLQDYPHHLKQMERQIFDGMGTGWEDILPGDPGYLEAAPQWTAGFLQDSGFRAYMRGSKAFEEWWNTADAHHVRMSTIMDEGGATRLYRGWEEAFDTWDTLFNDVLLHQAKADGVAADVAQAFRETAASIDNVGGAVRELPQMVYSHLGPIRGVRKIAPHQKGLTRMTDSFFDHFFMRPVNYRRGFLADLAKTHEARRLRELFVSQGKKIVPDSELMRHLDVRGMQGMFEGMRPHLYDMARRSNIIPEGYIDELATLRAIDEIDNTLFTFSQGSRAGSQSRFVFPFGKPWADMAGFWGREVMTKPHLRGYINNRTFMNIGQTANDLVQHMPFNPKPLATISRIANTDFRIDRGFVGEGGGVIPFLNEESSDFSPLIFMPKQGENPFLSMVPGLGPVPLHLIDRYIANIDPLEDPEGYQQRIDAISDFIPSAAFQRNTLTGEVLGGGTTASIVELGADVVGGTQGVPFYNVTNELGDISREINRSRELSALLADPENLEELMALTSPEEIEDWLKDLAREADINASRTHGLETASRMFVPARNEFDDSLDQIYDVWLEASNRFPELDVRPDLRGADVSGDPELRRQYADDVRRSFFKLPQWQRDLFIAEYPQLAVNLVSSWDWTDLARNDLMEAQTAYRSSGTDEGLALHQFYVDNGYIRPISPLARAHRILGLMQNAEHNAAKSVYEFTAENINDEKWDQFGHLLEPQLQRWLDTEVDGRTFGEFLLVDNPKDLWLKWGQLEGSLEDFMVEALGAEHPAVIAAIESDRVKISEKFKAWSMSWPGNEAPSARFADETLTAFDDRVVRLAEGLGIDLTPGMNGQQLFNGVNAITTEVDTPLFQMVNPAYEDYILERSVAARSAKQDLLDMSNSVNYDAEWRGEMSNFILFADRAVEQYINSIDFIPLSVQQEAVDRYMRLWNTSDINADWEGIWERKYERTFGPLEWTPPVPRSPFDENGELIGDAWTPYIRYIPDGDTLIVSENRGPAALDLSSIGLPTFGSQEGLTDMHAVRLIGVRAADFGSNTEGALLDKEALEDALFRAAEEGLTVYLVRDPDNFGATDHFGRELAWLWIGSEEAYYREDDFRRTD